MRRAGRGHSRCQRPIRIRDFGDNSRASRSACAARARSFRSGASGAGRHRRLRTSWFSISLLHVRRAAVSRRWQLTPRVQGQAQPSTKSSLNLRMRSFAALSVRHELLRAIKVPDTFVVRRVVDPGTVAPRLFAETEA